MPKGAPIPEVDESALEREIVEATRTWDEDLVEALRADVGDEAGGRLIGLYGKAFPEAYKEDVHPRVAVTDIRRIEMLDSDDAVEVGPPPGTAAARRTSGGSSSTAAAR